MSSTVSEKTVPLHQCKTGLVEYACEFGFSIYSLKAEQILMVLASRNLEILINSLNDTPLSVSNKDISASSLATKEGGAQLESRVRDLPYTLPTDNMEVSQVCSVHDLPHILPHQWHIEDQMSEVFWKQLATGELLKRSYLDTAESLDADKSTQFVSDYEAMQCSPDSFSQRAFTLLDISLSMNNNDHRGAIARGAALAFAKRSFSYDARMHLAPFREKVTEIISGRGQEIFIKICHKILNAENKGITNIQAALDFASELLLKEPAYSNDDMLLITDGLSRLARRPPANIRLHTILIGDTNDRTHPELINLLKITEQTATLHSWSNTFHRIKGDGLYECLKIKSEDLAELMQVNFEDPTFLTELENFLKVTKTDNKQDASMKEDLFDRIEKNKQLAAEHFVVGQAPTNNDNNELNDATLENAPSAGVHHTENPLSVSNAQGAASQHALSKAEKLTRRAGGSKVNDPMALLRILFRRLKTTSLRIREWVSGKMK